MGERVDEVVDWLLAGDPAVAQRTRRTLLGDHTTSIDLASVPGDVATILAARHQSGHWGRGFYEPKWTSTHYSLLELTDLGLDGSNAACRQTIEMVLKDDKGADGGLNPSGSVKQSDVCINGMALRYCSHFRADQQDLASMVDFLLSQRMPDGGFNCRSNRSGATHSSLHTTVSVLEGTTAYLSGGYTYRADEVRDAQDTAAQFLLAHRLYRSHHTGDVIRPELTRLHHPPRWHFDILRGLAALAKASTPYDERMQDALDVLRSRQRPDGRWAGARGYPGQTHLSYPRPHEPNRWVTLRAREVLLAYAG